MRVSGTLAATAALAALAGGCGSGGADQAGQPSLAAATSHSVVTTLEGRYARNMTKADIERTDRRRQIGHQERGANQETPEPGALSLRLTDSTLKLTDLHLKVTVVQDFSATADGAFRIGAYEHPETGSFCGPEVPETASYRWRLSGEVLTLKATADPCGDRDSMLSGGWKRR
jgi:hypothetical protein